MTHKRKSRRKLPSPAEVDRKVKAKAEKYIADSDLAKEDSCEDIANTAASLYFVLEHLAVEKLTGTGNAEEMRNITAVAGAYRRAMNDLGVMAERVEAEEEEL